MFNEYVGNEALAKASQLTKIGTDASGWDTYYREEQSGEYWLLYYPDSHLHGGGIAHLKRTTSAVFLAAQN